MGVIIFGVAVLLAVLQYRWIRDSNRLIRDREYRSTRISVERALEELGNEVRALATFALVPPATDAQTIDPDDTFESIALWKEQTEEPELLGALYLFDSGEENAIEITDEGPVEVALPDAYRLLAPANSTLPSDAVGISSLLSEGTIVLPYDYHSGKPAGAEVSSSDRKYVIVELDMYVLLSKRLRVYMDRYLPGYSYRIVRGDQVKYAYGAADYGSREPDAVHALFSQLADRRSVIYQDFGRQTVGEAAVADASAVVESRRIPSDYAKRYWFLSFSNLGGLIGRVGESGDESNVTNTDRAFVDTSRIMHIEIYYPNAPLSLTLRRRMFADLAVSYGAILLFLGALLSLYAVFRRSEGYRMREREFMSAMSHELRTPVSVIGSISENLADGVTLDPSRLSEYGGLIREQAHRLGRMVESILMVSGLNDKGSEGAVAHPVGGAEWAKTNVASVVEDVIRTLETVTFESGVVIKRDFFGDLDGFYTDAVALRLILENLLMNATRHGRAQDSTEHPVFVGVRISTDRDPDSRSYGMRTIELVVEDEGPGIPVKEQRRIFEAFYRGQATRDTQTPGSGLGLHLVRRVVASIGGTVRVESPYDRRGESVRGVRMSVELAEGEERADG